MGTARPADDGLELRVFVEDGNAVARTTHMRLTDDLLLLEVRGSTVSFRKER